MKTRIITALLLLIAAIIPAAAQSAGSAKASDYPFYDLSADKPLFTWGAEAGANIDLSGNDMSTIAFNMSFGARWRWVRFAGIGAEADITVSNSNRYFPIYAVFRTNFMQKPSRLFWEVRGGMALQYHENSANTTGAFAYTGVGWQLAENAKFSSYMTLGYTFVQRKSITTDDGVTDLANLSNASVRIGVVF